MYCKECNERMFSTNIEPLFHVGFGSTIFGDIITHYCKRCDTEHKVSTEYWFIFKIDKSKSVEMYNRRSKNVEINLHDLMHIEMMEQRRYVFDI
jgi:hypothetical protein